MAGPWNCSHRLAWTWQAVVTGHRREAGATGEGRRGASRRTPHQAGGVRATRNTLGGQGHPLAQGERQRCPGPHCAPLRHDLWGLASGRGAGSPGPRRSSAAPIPSPPPRTAAASSPQTPEAVRTAVRSSPLGCGAWSLRSSAVVPLGFAAVTPCRGSMNRLQRAMMASLNLPTGESAVNAIGA